MKIFAKTILVLVFLAHCAGNAFSCSCVERSARKDYRSAKAIFIGEVIGVSQGNLPASVKFKVEKQWKGAKQSEFIASWGYEGVGTCGGFLFEKGQKYLVYVHGKELSVYTACDRTAKLGYVKDELKRLNSFWFRFSARVYPL